MRKLTTAEFITKAKLVHGDKYDYSLVDYEKDNTKVKIICPEHGVFEQAPTAHKQRQGCKKCGIKSRSLKYKLTTSEVINQFTAVHGDKYDYSLVDYEKGNTKVKIICPEHGVFEQIPKDHKRGKGCKKCAIDQTGWSRYRWVKAGREKGRQFKLYLLKAKENKEVFYKIGITYKTVNHRANQMPYEFKVVDKVISFDGEYIWNLERQIKNKVKNNQYLPKIEFGGHTECFKLDSKIKKIAQIIAQV